MKRSIRGALLAAAMCAGLTAASAGAASATTIGTDEGCTPGYWKNHTSSWEEYAPGMKLRYLLTNEQYDALGTTSKGLLDGKTFADALQGGGGKGIDGAARILLRAATAAYLNAAHEEIGFPYRRFNDPFNIQQQLFSALQNPDRDTMLTLASVLDEANNLGCPLN